MTDDGDAFAAYIHSDQGKQDMREASLRIINRKDDNMATKKKTDEELQQEQQAHEAEVVTGMAQANEIALTLFGDQANAFATGEIYEFLLKTDEEEFAKDLRRVIDHAKTVYKTDAPSPEQVFDLFERIFDIE